MWKAFAHRASKGQDVEFPDNQQAIFDVSNLNIVGFVNAVCKFKNIKYCFCGMKGSSK